MPVTQEGPDRLVTLLSCPCIGLGEAVEARSNQEARNGRARREQFAASSAAWTPTRTCMSRRSSMSRTVFSGRQCFATTRQGYRQMLAWMRSFGEVQRVGIEVDRQLWRRPAALPAAGRGRGPGGHDAGQAGSAPARQERRSRCPERGACGLCRQAHRHPEKPRRDDRGLARLERLPEDRGGGAARRPADDPEHDRLRAGRDCGTCCAA